MLKTSAQVAVNLCYGQRTQLHLLEAPEAQGPGIRRDALINTLKLLLLHQYATTLGS